MFVYQRKDNDSNSICITFKDTKPVSNPEFIFSIDTEAKTVTVNDTVINSVLLDSGDNVTPDNSENQGTEPEEPTPEPEPETPVEPEPPQEPENSEPTVTVTNVTINDDSTWRVDIHAENLNDGFFPDAWFGIYDSEVTQEQLSQYRGDAGLSAWAYVTTNVKESYGEATAIPSEKNLYIDSSLVEEINNDNIWAGIYTDKGLLNGVPEGRQLKVILFYTDGNFNSDGYTVAAESPAFDLV